MSKEAVEGFLQQMKGNKELQDRLQARADGESDPIAHIVESASELGFEFTAKEFLETQEGIHEQLTDEQLETVAGGQIPKGERIVKWTFHW